MAYGGSIDAVMNYEFAMLYGSISRKERRERGYILRNSSVYAIGRLLTFLP